MNLGAAGKLQKSAESGRKIAFPGKWSRLRGWVRDFRIHL